MRDGRQELRPALSLTARPSMVYGLHICVDSEKKLFRKFVVTSANVHNNQCLEYLLDFDNAVVNV